MVVWCQQTSLYRNVGAAYLSLFNSINRFLIRNVIVYVNAINYPVMIPTYTLYVQKLHD